MMGELTAEERVSLIRAANAAWDDGAATVSGLVGELLPTVERIFAARRESLAERVRALADRWERLADAADHIQRRERPSWTGPLRARADELRALLDDPDGQPAPPERPAPLPDPVVPSS